MIKKSEIAAVVVSYNGDKGIFALVDSISPQVNKIYIVDNGSCKATKIHLEQISRYAKVSVNYLESNFGIGFALNFGIERARNEGHSWVITMDQDSLPDKLMVEKYIEFITENKKIKSVCPNIEGVHIYSNNNVEVEYAITSGNMVSIDLVYSVGMYDVGFFIDGVDFDFSAKVRLAGEKIYKVGGAGMMHCLGDGNVKNGLISRFHTSHSPLRRYYIFRNLFYFSGKYMYAMPKFTAKYIVTHLFYLITIILYGPRRLYSFAAVILAIIDVSRKKMGRCNHHIP